MACRRFSLREDRQRTVVKETACNSTAETFYLDKIGKTWANGFLVSRVARAPMYPASETACTVCDNVFAVATEPFTGEAPQCHTLLLCVPAIHAKSVLVDQLRAQLFTKTGLITCR